MIKKSNWATVNWTLSQQMNYAMDVVAHGVAIKYKSMHYHACADFLRAFNPTALYMITSR